MLLAYLCCLIKNSKPIAGNKYGALPWAPFPIERRVFQLSRDILRKVGELIQPIVRRDGQQDSTFRRVVTERPRGYIWTAKLAYAEKTYVRTRIDVIRPYVFVPDVVHSISVKSEGGAFTLQLEDNETVVVTCL